MHLWKHKINSINSTVKMRKEDINYPIKSDWRLACWGSNLLNEVMEIDIYYALSF